MPSIEELFEFVGQNLGILVWLFFLGLSILHLFRQRETFTFVILIWFSVQVFPIMGCDEGQRSLLHGLLGFPGLFIAVWFSFIWSQAIASSGRILGIPK
jgi:hypothetical protein